MDDTPAAGSTAAAPTRDTAPDAAATTRAPAWPSPPPQTVEHAVALLASAWTRGRGAA